MKKSLKFFLPILAVSSTCLFACKKDEKEKTHLTYGNIHMTEASFDLDLKVVGGNYQYELSYNTLKEKIESKNENFMLAVVNNGCECWTTFSAVLNQYCNETKAVCYTINLESIINENHFGIKMESSSSSFAVFKNGTCKFSLCTNSNQNEMYDYQNFKNLLDKRVILPKMMYIEEEDYTGKIYTTENPKDAVVYLKRSGCGDCKRIDQIALKPYFESHSSSNVLYILDCQKYVGTEGYATKKAEFGMTDSTFGYGEGLFPFFVYIKNGAISSAASAYNESVNSENKLTGTYYTPDHVAANEYQAEVLEGKQLSSDDVLVSQEVRTWKQEPRDATYKSLIESFLNYALPKVTSSL